MTNQYLYSSLILLRDCFEIIWNKNVKGYIYNDSTWISVSVHNAQQVEFGKQAVTKIKVNIYPG
jgi:hypothetical protein